MFETVRNLTKTARWFLVAGLGLLIGASGRPAEAVRLNETVRRVDEVLTTRDVLGEWKKPATADRLDCEFGGWSGITMASFSDDDNSRTAPDPIDSLLLQDLRVWTRVWLRNGMTAYLRLREIGYSFGTATGLNDPDLPSEGVDLDLGYLDAPAWGGNWRLGRQYVRYGSGLVLANVVDGARFTGQRGSFGYGVMLVRNKPRELDLDSNITAPRRFFEGVDFDYLRRDQHRVFGYLLAERDKSPQPAGITVATQGFHYDANYLGAGARGPLSHLADYHLEGIFETGSSYAIGASGKDAGDIRAFAGLARVTHQQDRPMHPVYSAEYAFGSGDAGRQPGISTVTLGPVGATDRNFLGFGRYDGGIALNPRLSNLHVLRFGASARPWDDAHGFEDLILGGTLSFYRKADAAGNLSDPQAVPGSGDVGSGTDLYLGWKIYSDLTWMVQYGHFSPGDTYPVGATDETDVLFSNLTWSF
ncbi:MAG: alginate export family protein [Candidatus Riflebacteria bacterium]|nr:alginate export family protein [Candidatus Riflebacteria bacterium]